MNLNPFRRAIAPTIPMHQPQRADGETQALYKVRREASRDSVERATLTGWYVPGGENGRKTLRDAQRKNGSMKRRAGAFAAGLRAAITRKNLQAIPGRRAIV